MSIETDRNRVIQLQKSKAPIERSLNTETTNMRRREAEISNIMRSINKNTSTSAKLSKQRQIDSKNKQILSYKKKIMDLNHTLSAKDGEILKIISKIEKAEEQLKKKIAQEEQKASKKLEQEAKKRSQEEKKRLQEEKKNRELELKHNKEMTKELHKQQQIHAKLSSSPIVVNFEKLPKKIVVLFIASNPTDQTQLRLDEEIRTITQKIRESEYRNSVELKSVWAARPTDLLQAINEYKPTIVHFSGHGSDNDELILQDDSGETKEVSLKTIVEMFKMVSSGIKLVVFNTCFSENQANEITQHISAAIGMNTSIGDEAARVFSAQLYSAIGFGKNINEAFGQAKVALMLESILENETPQLFIKPDVNENELYLVNPN